MLLKADKLAKKVKLKSMVRQEKSRVATALIVVQRGEWIIAWL